MDPFPVRIAEGESIGQVYPLVDRIQASESYAIEQLPTSDVAEDNAAFTEALKELDISPELSTDQRHRLLDILWTYRGSVCIRYTLSGLHEPHAGQDRYRRCCSRLYPAISRLPRGSQVHRRRGGTFVSQRCHRRSGFSVGIEHRVNQAAQQDQILCRLSEGERGIAHRPVSVTSD